MTYEQQLKEHYKAVRQRMLKYAKVEKKVLLLPTPEPSVPPKAGLVTEEVEKKIVEEAVQKTHVVLADICAAEVLADENPHYPKLPPIPGLVLYEPGAVRWMRILHAVARLHGIEASEILGTSRKKHIINARFEVFYRLRIDLRMSYTKISQLMKKDHTTVLHGVTKFRQLILDRRIEVTEDGHLRFGNHLPEDRTHSLDLSAA